MEQNSKEWLDFREASLGSSDAGTIMGVSEYMTPYQLWLQRTGRTPEQSEKFAFALGHRFEPYIRALAESRLGEQFEPDTIRSETFPFMHASVDGRNFSYDQLLEIKLNKADFHSMVAAKGWIPELHRWQMQHQLIVTGAKVVHYVSAPHCDDPAELSTDDLAIVPVYPSMAMQDSLIAAEGAFVENLANDEPPALLDADGIQMRSASWKRNAAEYLKYNKQIDALKAKQKKSATRLKDMSGEASVARGYGIVVKNTLVKGRLQYAKIPELKGVELDEYKTKSFIKTTYSEDN